MDPTCFTARALMARFGLVADQRVTRVRLPEGPSRRAFLAGLTAVVASGLVDLSGVDTNKLLWEPGKKTFLLPPEVALATPEEIEALDLEIGIGGGNQFLTIEWITKEALRHLENNLKLTKNFHREYEGAFGAKTLHVNIRKPKQRQFTKVDVRGDVLRVAKASLPKIV